MPGGAMRGQLAESRAGVAKFPSDDEEIFVTFSLWITDPPTWAERGTIADT